MFEDGERIPEVEFFVDDGGAVSLHAVVGQVFFLLGEEVRLRSGLWEVPEREDGESNRATAFHDEQVAPIC